jgi:catechol 2,3-dioxygenase-like lactoylglutathione lyase family enzyme
MSTTQDASSNAGRTTNDGTVDMKLEVVIIPVSDVDRSKQFYQQLGWRLDADIARGDTFRIVQFTPPGSGCSIQFGKGLTAAAAGSGQGQLIVADIEAARVELVGRGVDTSEVFHGAPFGPGRQSGPDPERQSYRSYLSFDDPDGNGWLLQEVTTRLPGRVDPATTAYTSARDLAEAMRRASIAHGEHEKRIGQADADWPDWYATYMVAEQAGTEPPQ